MAERTKKEKAEYKRRLERKFKKASKGRNPQKLSKAAMDAYKKMGVKPKDFSKVKPNQEMMGKFKKYSRPKAKTATAVAKRSLGKAIARKLPVVGAAIIAHDVAKGVSKYINFKDCMKRGGAWDDGKCVGVKKRKVKLKGAANREVRDPISKR